MRYMFIIPILYIWGTISLYAEENSLGDILQGAGKNKALIKPAPQKKTVKKRSRFVFKDTYDANDIKSKAHEKKKSQSYEYANKSRFKFKINDGSPQSNMMGGSGGISAGMAAGGASGGSMGGGGKGRGGR